MAKRRRNRSDREVVSTADVVPIIGDGAIAGPIVEGSTIPLLIIDTSTRPDIEEIIRVHSYLSPGDVTFRWGGVKGQPDEVLLRLTFQRPIESRAVLLFSIEKQGILVEAALTAGAIYLQSGAPGDRLMNKLDHPRILVELSDAEFRAIWDRLFLERMTTVIRAKNGMPRREAEAIAQELIANLRVVTKFRVPPRYRA